MLDLSHRQGLAWLARLVADVRSAAPDLRPLVVGALARDLWLHHGFDIKIERATQDVDFALAVDWQGCAQVTGEGGEEKNQVVSETMSKPTSPRFLRRTCIRIGGLS